MRKKINTQSASGTERIGKNLARSLRRGCIIALEGNLGAGKTVLTKGIAKGLGIRHAIQSPTFVLMKVYPVKRPGIAHLVHVDCYRLTSSRDLRGIGLEDYLHDATAVVVIEWADKIRDLLPSQRMTIQLIAKGAKDRVAIISGRHSSSSGRQGTARVRPR